MTALAATLSPDQLAAVALAVFGLAALPFAIARGRGHWGI